MGKKKGKRGARGSRKKREGIAPTTHKYDSLKRQIDWKMLPPDIYQSLFPILEKLEPYEEIADSVWEAEGDLKNELIDLLIFDGIIDRSFQKHLEKITEDCFWHFVKGRRKIIDIYTAGRYTDRHSKALQAIYNWGIDNKRPLFASVIQEISVAGGEINIEEQINQWGLKRYVNDVRSRQAREVDDTAVDVTLRFFMVADRVNHTGLNEEVPDRYNEVTKNLFYYFQDADFTTPKRGIRVYLEDPTLKAMGYYAEFFMLDEYEPQILIGFNLISEKRHPPIQAFISRIDGEIMPGGNLFSNARRSFRFMGAEPAYDRIRGEMMRALFKAFEEGEIDEVAFLDNPEEVLSEKKRKEVEEQQAREALAEELLDEEEIPAEEFGSMVGEMDPDKVRRVAKRERRLSHRRILKAFKRCGATISYGSKHPRLRRGDKVTTFINKHDDDPKFNKQIVKQAREALGISEDDFYAALK